jgi:hypothetical protein
VSFSHDNCYLTSSSGLDLASKCLAGLVGVSAKVDACAMDGACAVMSHLHGKVIHREDPRASFPQGSSEMELLPLTHKLFGEDALASHVWTMPPSTYQFDEMVRFSSDR